MKYIDIASPQDVQIEHGSEDLTTIEFICKSSMLLLSELFVRRIHSDGIIDLTNRRISSFS